MMVIVCNDSFNGGPWEGKWGTQGEKIQIENMAMLCVCSTLGFETDIEYHQKGSFGVIYGCQFLYSVSLFTSDSQELACFRAGKAVHSLLMNGNLE